MHRLSSLFTIHDSLQTEEHRGTALPRPFCPFGTFPLLGESPSLTNKAQNYPTKKPTSHRRGGNLPPEKPSLEIKKAPLCKGSCHEVTEGLLTFHLNQTFREGMVTLPYKNPPKAAPILFSFHFYLFTLHFNREDVKTSPTTNTTSPQNYKIRKNTVRFLALYLYN